MSAFHDYFAEIGAVIAIIVWIIRLEGKVGQNEKVSDLHAKEIAALDNRLREFDSKLLSKLSEIAERLSFIEGAIKGAQHGKE